MLFEEGNCVDIREGEEGNKFWFMSMYQDYFIVHRRQQI